MATKTSKIVVTPKGEGGNSTPNAKVWHKEIGKLVDDAVSSTDAIESVTAKLSIAMYEAMKSSDMSPVEVLGWMKSKDKKKSATTLSDWCELFSGKYRGAVDEIKTVNSDKTLTTESSKARLLQANRQIKAARNAITKSIMVGYWLYKMAPEAVTVRSSGAIRLSHKKEELDGVFAVNNLIKRSRDAFYESKATRAPRPADNTTPTLDGDPAKSLETATAFITATTNGKNAADFTGPAKDQLQGLLVTLLGTFASTDGVTLDTESIVDMYKAASKGA